MGNGSPARLILGAALAVLLAAPAVAACSEGAAELRLPGGSTMRFSVEVADTDAERSKGLMFREAMATGAGMLFLYEQPQRATFWMKNTLIPLDMIFADATGTVTRVHPRAVPGDLTTIDGGEGVLAVLEINGGLAERLGIVPGTVLRHPALDQETAAWPCAE
jgi:uncharacterized membrane protein (UPF0127 family)